MKNFVKINLALVLLVFGGPAAFAQGAIPVIGVNVNNFPSTQATTTSNGALETGGNLAAINTAVNGATPAGANIIGQVSIDQTTNGGTNKVVTGAYPYQPLCPSQHNVALSTATALTLPTGIASSGTCVTQTVNATFANVCARGGSVNYEIDGATTPTGTIGFPLASGQCVPLMGNLAITNFKASQATTGATIDVGYFQ